VTRGGSLRTGKSCREKDAPHAVQIKNYPSIVMISADVRSENAAGSFFERVRFVRTENTRRQKARGYYKNHSKEKHERNVLVALLSAPLVRNKIRLRQAPRTGLIKRFRTCQIERNHRPYLQATQKSCMVQVISESADNSLKTKPEARSEESSV
jgi:hypothetical protein